MNNLKRDTAVLERADQLQDLFAQLDSTNKEHLRQIEDTLRDINALKIAPGFANKPLTVRQLNEIQYAEEILALKRKYRDILDPPGM